MPQFNVNYLNFFNFNFSLFSKANYLKIKENVKYLVRWKTFHKLQNEKREEKEKFRNKNYSIENGFAFFRHELNYNRLTKQLSNWDEHNIMVSLTKDHN